MDLIIDIFIFVLGLALGSFLNVCIYRIPKEESIKLPASHCPRCKKGIAWYDNIPVVSFILLRAKCRHCKERISLRYPIVELVSGVMLLALWMYYGLSPFFVAGGVLFLILLGVFFTDFETGYIPDKFSFFGMAMGLLLSSLYPELHGRTLWYEGLLYSGSGLLAGGAVLLAVGLLGNVIFRKESMGGGDIKLLAMIGAFVGVKKVVVVFFFSPILAIPYALCAKYIRKDETIAFGPFIALSGACFFVWGDKIIREFLF